MIAAYPSEALDIMSAVEANPAIKKKFGKGERSVPHHSEKASKWYPAHTDAVKRKVSQCRPEDHAVVDPSAILSPVLRVCQC